MRKAAIIFFIEPKELSSFLAPLPLMQIESLPLPTTGRNFTLW